MAKTKKKINLGLIVMSKGERIAVISLLSVIAILLVFSVFRPAFQFSKQNELAFHNLDSMIAAQEKVIEKPVVEQQSIPIIMLPIEEESEISNAVTNTPVKRVSKPAKSATTKEISIVNENKKIPILDINVADSLSLVELPQIGEVMASRIHRYRNRLGGFVSFEQLYEIKGMDSARYATIHPYIILETKEITKLNVNRDEFKTLLRHPYLEYEQVKAIVNHRERKGLIKNWEQLREITGEVNPFLEHYLSY